MELKPITGAEILKRTFKGINTSPLTSVYMPSHKYAVKYTHYGREHMGTFTTKRSAQEWIDSKTF